MLLFAHVLVHPLVHLTSAAAAPSSSAVAARSALSDSGVNSADQCELCRVGHNAVVTPQLPKTDLLNPRWIRTALQALNYASLQASRSIPSRAPPSL